MERDHWIRVLDAHELTHEKPRTIKPEGKQIVLFRLADDEVHAIDNRCPHEGYPLSTGMLSDGVLTCEWHNWKFRLCDGACILGGEDVRRYPLRIADGGIWLDIADAPADEAKPDLYRSLEHAFDDDDWGWAARTAERLMALGEAPTAILGAACDWAATHAPYGFDHGLAAAADLAHLLALPGAGVDDSAGMGADDSAGMGNDAAPVVLLVEAMNLMVQPNLRRPARELPEPAPVAALVEAAPDAALQARGDTWRALERQLRDRIESEDLAGAEALLHGALVAGAGPEQIFSWLVHAATDHFLGYGHPHIYCVKAEELLRHIGWQHAHPVLTSLVSNIVYETREDKLPYMREYRRLMEDVAPRLDEWANDGHGTSADRVADRVVGQVADRVVGQVADRVADRVVEQVADRVVGAAVDGTLADALAAVAHALEQGVAGHVIAASLSIAAAHRLLRFDARLEHDDDISEGWLHITHALTHADAVRETLLRRPSRDALRGLFHSARFIQHLAVCDEPSERRSDAWTRTDALITPTLPDLGLERALHESRAPAAMAAIRAGWPEHAQALRQSLYRAVLADRATGPIFVIHHLKTTLAALRLTEGLHDYRALQGRTDRDLPLVATVRFLAHPLQERRVARQAKIARVFVREGRMQKKLIGY